MRSRTLLALFAALLLSLTACGRGGGDGGDHRLGAFPGFGSPGQVLYTNGTPSQFWAQPPYDNISTHSGIDCTGATDSYTALQAILTADAGTSCVYIPPNCSLKIGTPLNPPSYTCLQGSGSAAIQSTIVGTGPTNALFYAKFTNLGTIATTTLSSGPAKGTRTLSVASSTGFAAGQQIIAISTAAANTEQQFTVLSTGVGTITVDDPVEFTFVTGDTVETYSPPIGVMLDGHGMTVGGSGGALFEMSACWHCTVANFEAPNTAAHPVTVTSYIGSMDVSGRDNLWYRMHVNAGGTAPYGLAIESEVRSKTVDCTATNGTIAGFWEATGARNEWRGDKAWNSTDYGLALATSSAADTDGVQRGRVDGCDFYQNGVAGIYLDGVNDEEIANSHLDYNTSNGIYAIESVGPNVNDTGIRLSNVTLNNEPNGIYTGSGAHDISGTNVEANSNSTSSLNLNASSSVFTFRNFRSTDSCLGGGHVVDIGAGVQLTLSGSRIRKTQNNTGAWIAAITDGAAARINLDDVAIELVGSPTGTTYGVFANAASTIVLHQVRTIGTLGVGFFSSGQASVWRWGSVVDVSSCTTPTSIDATAMLSRGTVTANGVTPVSVSFTDLKATDKVTLVPTSVAGRMPFVTKTAGTGFSITSLAGDTQVYDYVIQ